MAFTGVHRGLPDALVERVGEFLRGEVTVETPRDAATVVMLRDRPGPGVSVYLLHRVSSMPFAGGMHAFPGGGVDKRDADQAVGWVGAPPERWTPSLGADAPVARALVCAAVRETFEESGVLLAGPDAASLVHDTRSPDWDSDRASLVDRSLSFADMLNRRGLALRADLVHPWAHWITPEFEPRRYDTRFFVAALPEGQLARDASAESDGAAWVNAGEAISAYQRGDLPMMAPTAATVAELASYDSVAAVLAAARTRILEPWLPTVALEGGKASLVLPGDTGHGS